MTKNRQKLFVELVKQVLQSPAYKSRATLRQAAADAAEPVIADLRINGIVVGAIDALRSTHPQIHDAVPILLKWLPKISHPLVRMSIVRRLSIPKAAGIALPTLVKEFNRTSESDGSLKWAIGNALAITATPKQIHLLAEIASNKKHGRSREMVVLALSKSNELKIKELLLKLLNDEDVKGHAIVALGNLRVTDAKPMLNRLLKDDNAWIRKEARLALRKIG